MGISLTFISTPALANLGITSTTTATTLQTALQGNNVAVSGVTVNEGTTTGQIGTFTGGLTGGAGPVLGINDGVVMVTGTVASAAGPNNTSSITTGGETGPIDTNLATVDGGQQFDTAIMSFNVVPSGNFLAVDFVFGSDEYNEYVCTIFNDAMGIFVSGPGITGTANIARLSTNLSPISVNQINRGIAGAASTGGTVAPCNLTNSAFYVKNIGDSTAESTGTTNSALGAATSSAFTNLQYDGFTVPLTAQVKVIPGTTYTIKVVIADIGDGSWDSGLFIDGVRSFNLDLGDAPDSYGTRPIDQTIQLPGPARHSTGQDIYLGAIAPEAEDTVTPATSPNAANADDLTGTDDEDAFGGDLSLAAGITSYSLNGIPVHNGVTSTAKLMGWIDFNKDGDFLDAGEVASVSVAPGQTAANLSWSGFTAPTTGTSYARFRITTDPNITVTPTPLDLALNGEVEDYRVIIANLDYGDAPDPSVGTGVDNYKTTASDGGPSHVIVSGLSLGANIDNETGTFQNTSATTDDINGTPNDEDGITSFPILTTASGKTYTVPASVTKSVSGNAYLVGYIDFNKDGDFDDTGEKSSTVTVSASGTQNVSFTTPSGITIGDTYARFRLSSTQVEAESSVGTATSGEVEDYKVTIAGNPNVLLVKRITGVNGSSNNGGIFLDTYDPETNTSNPSYAYDKNIIQAGLTPPSSTNWPNTTGATSSTFLLGARDGGNTKSNDEVEYTVYFLSAGSSTAKNVTICDRIPRYQAFVPDAFNSLTVAPNTTPASPGGDRGIAVFQGSTTNADTVYGYTNIGDGDAARYYPPGSPLPSACTQPALAEDNGTIVVNLGDIPNATTPGTPKESYGFLRFRAKVK